MKATYQAPQAEPLLFTAEEIRTDLVSTSNGNGLSGSWKDLVDEEDLVV